MYLHSQPATRNPQPAPRGFTLVELMISIALMLLLIAGINAVFTASSNTTGTGMAFSAVTRDLRALERMFNRDFAVAVPMTEMPILVIISETQRAWTDFADAQADADGDVNTFDIDGDGTEDTLQPGEYAYRTHRVDRILFFARDNARPFRRQTANDITNPPNELISQDASREAMIWYGHLALPDRTKPFPNRNTDFYDPGKFPTAPASAANSSNYYANDWILGRSAILLREYPFVPGEPPQSFLVYTPALFSPLGEDNPARGAGPAASDGMSASALRIFHSRYDAAETTIAQFREDADATIASMPAAGPPWWQEFDYRFLAKPNPNRGAISAVDRKAETALTVPVLQRGVTQFIVEFAGDYFTQQNNPNPPSGPPYGAITSIEPDGEIDFLVPAPGARRVRWYGLPRNVDFSDDTNGPLIRGNINDPNRLVDVVPIDIVHEAARKHGQIPQSKAGTLSYHYPCEDPNKVPRPIPNFITDLTTNQYIAAWTPQDLLDGQGPKMIRIVMTLTDSNGRLGQGQTVEYVFNMPQ